MSQSDALYKFYLGEAPAETPSGELTPAWILQASDEELEARHDWIQWAFPTTSPSSFTPDTPTVRPEQMELIGTMPVFKAIYQRFMIFLERTEGWRKAGDHNHWRITRALTSLMLAELYSEAQALFRVALKHGNPDFVTIDFWERAMKDHPAWTISQTTLRNGVLTIRIGVHILAEAVRRGPFADTIIAQAEGDEGAFQITDEDQFAREVLRALEDEDPNNGDTLVTRMLDDAAGKAIENGAEGVMLNYET